MADATDKAAREIEKPSILLAIIPLLATIGLVALQVFYYGDVSPHIPLAIGILITAAFGWYRCWSYVVTTPSLGRVLLLRKGL